MRFSKTTQCFYPDDIAYTSLPADIVACTQADFDLAMSRASGETLDWNGGKIVVIAVPALTLAQAQTAQIALLSAACRAQIYGGFQSSALGIAHTYPAKDRDQANLSASVLASLLPGLPANWTTPFPCQDAGGNWAHVQHTSAQIQQVGVDGKAAIVTAIMKNATLAQQVSAATTVAAVQAIVW